MTVLTRCFFFILDRPWGLPDWAHRALHYAPVAALAAVIAPEIVMTQGHLVTTWQDARLYAAAAGAAWYFWRAACSARCWRAWRCTCRCTWGWAGRLAAQACANAVTSAPAIDTAVASGSVAAR